MVQLSASSEYFPSFQEPYWTSLMPILLNKLSKKLEGIGQGNIQNAPFVETEESIILITHPLWNKMTIDARKNEFDKPVKCYTILETINKTRF